MFLEGVCLVVFSVFLLTPVYFVDICATGGPLTSDDPVLLEIIF